MDQTIVLYIYFGGIPVLIFLAGMFPEVLDGDDSDMFGWICALVLWPVIAGTLVVVGVIVAVFGLIFSLGGMVRKRLFPH